MRGPGGQRRRLLERNYPTGAGSSATAATSASAPAAQNWTVERLLQAHRQLEERAMCSSATTAPSSKRRKHRLRRGARAQPGPRRDLARFLYRRRSGAGLATPRTRNPTRAPDPQRCPAAGLCAALEPAGLLPHRPDLAAPEAADEVERLIGHPLPLRLDAITGPRRAPGDHSRLAAGRAHRGDSSAIPTDPRNVGGDLDPSSIPDKERAISALPDYASQPGKPPREDLK